MGFDMNSPLATSVLTFVLRERMLARRCYGTEVEQAGADCFANELQRCGLLLGASGESVPPCPALGWPACKTRVEICDSAWRADAGEGPSLKWAWEGRWVGGQGWS